ncbi:hypothetical protein L1765_06680 [Microaerobacter geothermalis]|uniref:hypothetical protein n=1 Tax=Microaerobacter geothermalis TaxID=674972 RepID=UPI001F458BFE|nr:hypothetical protein [Microaerobacter geothermalis]MCF6093673.1 hypothetical protein [Microaerobacter geothermalis]
MHNSIKHPDDHQFERYGLIDNIHEMVEVISQELKKPVTIEAKNFDLIAYSANHQEVDSARQKTILEKKVPSFVVDRLNRAGIIRKLESTNHPIRIPPLEEVGLTQRIAMSIGYQKQVIGYIWIQEDFPPLTEKEFQFLENISGHIARILLEISSTKKAQ